MGTLKGRKQPMPGDLGSPHQPGAGRRGQLAPLGVPVLWFPHRCPLHMAGPHPRATSSHRNENRSFISLGSIITSFLNQTTFCFLLLFSYMTPAPQCSGPQMPTDRSRPVRSRCDLPGPIELHRAPRPLRCCPCVRESLCAGGGCRRSLAPAGWDDIRPRLP